MKKRTIFNLYWVSLPFLIILGILMSSFFARYSSAQAAEYQDSAALNACFENSNNCAYYQSQIDNDAHDVSNATLSIVVGGLFYLAFATLYFIGWVGALVNLSRAREWGWFWGVLLFSGIMLPIYAASGPEPLTPAQGVSLKQQRAAGYPAVPPQYPPPPPGYLAVPPQYPPGYVPPPRDSSALAILKERYARGEMDSETYERMRAQLEQ